MGEWEQVEFLLKLSRVLAEAEDQDGLIQGLLDCSASFFGAWCAIHEANEHGLLRLSRVFSLDSKKCSVLMRQVRGPSELEARVFESRESVLFVQRAEARHASNLFRETGTASGLVLSISTRLRNYGTLSIGSLDQDFSDRDLLLGKDLAARASLALDRIYLSQQLENSLKERDNLISITSHDIRVPLTSLKLLMELLSHILRSPERLSGAYDRVIDIIQSAHIQVDQSTALLEQMLSFSRIETGPLEIGLDPVDLAVVIAETQAILRPQLERSGIHLEVSCPKSCLIQGEAVRLRQVLVNLLTNSIKYAGNKRIRIELGTSGKKCQLRVIDYGKGIRPEFREKIFDRFDRGTEPCDGLGHGLGLYISRKIIEAHQGKVWAEATKPKGSTFVIELPTSLR